jgi:predicted membrane-bound mannosyltransferase
MNPYVYAHTTDRIQRLVDDLDRLAAVAPAGYDMRVKLIWEGNYYWPLPWYLRRFSRVEYWNRVPADAAAAIVLASPQHDQALTARLSDTHFMTGYYEIRPNVLAMLWVRDDVWVAHVDRLQRERQQSSGDGGLQPRR